MNEVKSHTQIFQLVFVQNELIPRCCCEEDEVGGLEL